MTVKPIRTDVSQDSPYGPEHDSCALYFKRTQKWAEHVWYA